MTVAKVQGEHNDISMNWENASESVPYTAAKLGSAVNGVDANATATTESFGIVQTKAAQNEQVDVRQSGLSRMKVNGNSTNIAAGDDLTVTTGGVGIKTTTLGNWVVARALEPSTADGDIIAVEIRKYRIGTYA